MMRLPLYVPPNELVNLKTKQMILDEYGQETNFLIERHYLTVNLPVNEGPFKIGDIVWSKLPNFPYWPAIVMVEPEQGQYCYIPSGCHYTEYENFQYYLNYFGRSVFIGWNYCSKLLPFKGYKALINNIQLKLQRMSYRKASTKCEKYLSNFHVSDDMKDDWNYSVCEAELAMKLDLTTRLSLLAYEYR
ncbi:hypothetical protein RDWZM_005635 [Blomia tropicalis]|uniref:PWWP domain-containing protein n=1 Tax=Blomia tropicalis TaxID=40697 RepID=A0A9Q0M753_BLOTA|nr:hypothetical protein RDWZM_005635 [Blomia tropicalis]